jgi:signal transduction histidine kinase
MELTIHSKRLNRGGCERALTLRNVKQRLKEEVSRRHALEDALRESERYSARLVKQSQLLHGRLRDLSQHTLAMQEEERKRISRELHDIVAQMLTGIIIQLTSIKSDAMANTPKLRNRITQTQRLVEKSVDAVHRFARTLRPPELSDLGLIPALHGLLKHFRKQTGIYVTFSAFADIEKLDCSKRTSLYRIAYEALTNIAKHAHASKVTVNILKRQNTVCMEISDNGHGFDVNDHEAASGSKHLGLLGIRERVEMLDGQYLINSTPNKGTGLHIRIPF